MGRGHSSREEGYPISIFCIIATEFCERFSFCGLRTILSIYLRNELLLPENMATIVYHVFIMFCYIIPLVGAICADSILGRYRTILYFSIIYLVGNILMCLAAIPPLEISPLCTTVAALTIIAIGTGGIKPCVAAFGGDQFYLPRQSTLLQQFFSIFYFTINLGGFVGMILTPILRKVVVCFGEDTCYALGFGFPAILMLLSLILFYLGKPWYRLKMPKDNVILQFLHCTIYAIMKKCESKENGRHWLDFALDKYDLKLVHDMKIVYAVFFLYTPLPIFWSLFDQQGSRWTFQASRMEGTFFGSQIVPDQMQVVNPALVLILIPLFDRIFYPFLTKLHILENPLFRMCIGGLLAGLAFISAGILELILEMNYPEFPGKHEATINIVNTLPCEVTIYNPFNTKDKLDSGQLFRYRNIYAVNASEYNVSLEYPQTCGNFQFKQTRSELSIWAIEYQSDTVIIGIDENNEITLHFADPVDFAKYLSGKPIIRVFYIQNSHMLHNISVSIERSSFKDIYFIPDELEDKLSVSTFMEIPPAEYEYIVGSNEESRVYEGTMQLALGGAYMLILSERGGNIEFADVYTLYPPNNVNILWLIPQYFLISVAEIMFGIAGLEFSFTQAPKSMKTVTIAAWYLSVALGNFLVIIITQAKLFKSQAYEFFLFAVLIVADMMLFSHMAANYQFVELEADSSAATETTPLVDVAAISSSYLMQ